MIQEYIPKGKISDIPFNYDEEAYPLDWTSEQGQPTFQLDDLPAQDHALYLINTVEFHVGQVYHLFDAPTFIASVRQFYATGHQRTLTPWWRLWLAHFLLIIAFGKALLTQVSSQGKFPGIDYFKRAISLLPQVPEYYQDSLLSVELLTSLSLYLQAIDHRNSAYVYLGIALRIATSCGLHLEATSEALAPGESMRRCKAWWTLYILDRKFSTLMGSPISIDDNDAAVQLAELDLPNESSRTYSIHVKLSQSLGLLVNSLCNSPVNIARFG